MLIDHMTEENGHMTKTWREMPQEMVTDRPYGWRRRL